MHMYCMFQIAFALLQIEKDDGVRPTTTMEVLAKLRPAFQEGGTTTAGLLYLKLYLRLTSMS